jgi:uncharacterized protein
MKGFYHMLERIQRGRTDLVIEFIEQGNPANSTDSDGVSLLMWCAYYGDVSAIRFLTKNGETLHSLGENFDLNGAVFHGHWQLVQYLIECGADVNFVLSDTGESPLHAALCTADRVRHDRVIKVLLANGANPNVATLKNVPTGGFMRDCRTKGETPLHRAAAFGSERTIQMLIDAGAIINAIDMNKDSPLSWASWYLRPDPILRLLCFGEHRVRSSRDPDGMAGYVLGEP